MRRAVLMLLCASGCDLIITIEPPEPGACGPFDDPEPVPLAAGLPKLVGFSAIADRAIARTTDVPPRLFALVLANGEWVADPEYQTSLDALRNNERLHYGQLSFEGKLFGAIRSQTDPNYKVYQYRFATSWVLDSNDPVAFTSGQSILPGGSLITGAGGGDEFQYHATTQSDAMESKLVVVAKSVPQPMWTAEAVSGLLSTAPVNAKHDASQAALALAVNGRPAMIYAAKLRGGTSSSDLYVSQKRQGSWQVGVPIVELATTDDEVEPYTNANCTLLYFRRGENLFQARARSE